MASDKVAPAQPQQQSAEQPKKYRSKHADPNYKGEPCDKELANGPLEKRGCTDILCCLIFIAYMVGMVVVSGIAYKNGQPDLIVDPFDSDGTPTPLNSLLNPILRKPMRTRRPRELHLFVLPSSLDQLCRIHCLREAMPDLLWN